MGNLYLSIWNYSGTFSIPVIILSRNVLNINHDRNVKSVEQWLFVFDISIVVDIEKAARYPDHRWDSKKVSE